MAFPVAPPPEGGAPRWRAAEIFLCSYAAIVTITALTRIDLSRGNWSIALAHALIIVWLWLVTRPGLGPTGRVLREVMPLIIVLAGYGALDVLSGGGQLPAHDGVVLAWEQGALRHAAGARLVARAHQSRSGPRCSTASTSSTT